MGTFFARLIAFGIGFGIVYAVASIFTGGSLRFWLAIGGGLLLWFMEYARGRALEDVTPEMVLNNLKHMAAESASQTIAGLEHAARLLPTSSLDETTGNLRKYKQHVAEDEFNEAISELVKLGDDNNMDKTFW